MYAINSILNFSISLGPLRGIRVRVSLLLLVAVAAVAWRLGNPALGLLAGVILFLTVVAHQLAQVLVCQAGGHSATDVVLWPLGGLTTHGSEAGFSAQAKIQAVGPVVCLASSALCVFQLQHLGSPVDLMEMLGSFQVADNESLSITTLRMTCFFSLLVLGTNLIPVAPFDAGRLLRSFLAERYDPIEVNDVMLRLGLVVGALGVVCGFVFDLSAVGALSGFVLILHLHESGVRYEQSRYFADDTSEKWNDDFSEGDPEPEEFDTYRSPDELDTDELIARSSMMARRRARRETARRQREADLRRQEEEQLDAILDIIHRKGEDALNPAEQQLLRKASQRLRGKSQSEHREFESGH